MSIQSLLLVLGQVTLKLSLQKMGAFSWTWQFFVSVFSNLWFLACGLAFGSASILWMYILKHYPLSIAYPLTSVSYVIGMLAAIVVFREQVPAIRWVGLILIIIGVILIQKT